ncbi:hypothetical protein [Actinocorallia populi]|uniref:hypothetical protein n=1 Tax=Actinocorallia populi TaxID=2079200 RepID=UPI000D08DEFE|nr:hypothetical protein [Actinocorallia populi]
MTELLLTLHVLAAILAIGPITVAGSLFPRHMGAVLEGDGQAVRTAEILHRVCRGYALVGIAVPVFGFATGVRLGVLAEHWLIASVILTVLAAAVLELAIIPTQRRLLADPAPEGRPAISRLHMLTGVFNLLWAAVVVLMVVRPGAG